MRCLEINERHYTSNFYQNFLKVEKNSFFSSSKKVSKSRSGILESTKKVGCTLLPTTVTSSPV